MLKGAAQSSHHINRAGAYYYYYYYYYYCYWFWFYNVATYV